jgi:3-oxoacyl-[acyl-carrier-protein] synthase-3
MMSQSRIRSPRIVGIASCVPARRFDNIADTTEFAPDEVRKVVGMAGVSARRIVDDATCSTDLCFGAADRLLSELDCDRSTIDVLIMATQTPDYFMPSSSCLLQQRLGLPTTCAAFDLNLGCSAYPYGLWLAASLLATSGFRRVLLLNGETPTRYADRADRSVALLFGDAGSATLLERREPESKAANWSFVLHTDGAGFDDLIVRAGGFRDRFSPDQRQHFVSMNGSNVFNFTIRVIPPLIRDTLELAGLAKEDVDYFIFHQSNRFIMNHLVKKFGLPADRVPIILEEFGNTGGPSVPLTITQGGLQRPADRALRLMLLGYGVGLSWGSAMLDLDPEARILHTEWPGGSERAS